MRYKPTVAFALLSLLLAGAGPLEIDLGTPPPAPISGQLKVGGANPQGIRIDANNRYLTRDGVPFLPVMGEFHFSRYPHAAWEQELRKMKAGGITIVSAYIFWIHHEEVEGQWDWTGDKDLRQFVQLCDKVGLSCYLRLGPWDHGEARNGGFPDWLLAKVPARQLRTTDPAFMDYTRQLYAQIFQQVHGLLYKDGGPIIGIQVENELRNNAPYLLALKNMARDVGFNVPLYSMTGWGPARVPDNELLPMFGGYTDGFWIDGTQTSYSSTVQFFFTHSPNDERLRKNASFLPSPAIAYLQNFPFLTCEVGGGMAISYTRRPVIPAADVASAALCKLGDGSCLMGYYMYHGGANPPGKLTTLQESQATNYPNDMPEIDYDFQAPLGQFGQVRPSYDALRLLHTFIADFGPDLCTMPSTLPKVLPSDLDDPSTLRWCARGDGRRGFIFINNHQRGVTLPPKDAQFLVHLASGDLTVPDAPATIPSDSFMIWPFNLDLNGTLLRYATAQLLCRIDDNGVPCFVFFAPDGVAPSFAFGPGTTISGHKMSAAMTIAGDALNPGLKPIEVLSPDGRSSRIILLTQADALRTWKYSGWGGDRLLISPADLSFDGPVVLADSRQNTSTIQTYPPAKRPLTANGDLLAGSFAARDFTRPAVHAAKTAAGAAPRPLALGSHKKPLPPSDADFAAAATWHISIDPPTSPDIKDVYLQIDYTGDAARAYIGGQLIDDDFNDGQPLEIGLSRFGPDVYKNGIDLKILPPPAGFDVYIPNGTKDPTHLAPEPNLLRVTAHPLYEWQLRQSN